MLEALRRVGSRLAEVAPVARLGSAVSLAAHAVIGARSTAVPGIVPARIASARNGCTSTGEATEAIGDSAIGVRYPKPMFGVMRPNAIASEPAIAVTGEPVVPVMAEEEGAFENRAAEPIRPPAPASPTQAAEEAAKIDARSEAKSKAEGGIVERRVVAPGWRSPDVFGIVVRHVDYLRICRLNVNRGIAALRFGRYRLLSVRVQSTCRSGLRAHMLHGVHDVGLLCEECVSKVRRPSNIRIHPVQYIRKNHQRLNAGIPILLARRVDQLRALQTAILLEPLRGFGNLKGIRGGHQHLAQQGIGIKSDRRNQIIQLLWGKELCGRLLLRWRRGLLRGQGHAGRDQKQRANHAHRRSGIETPHRHLSTSVA